MNVWLSQFSLQLLCTKTTNKQNKISVQVSDEMNGDGTFPWSHSTTQDLSVTTEAPAATTQPGQCEAKTKGPEPCKRMKPCTESKNAGTQSHAIPNFRVQVCRGLVGRSAARRAAAGPSRAPPSAETTTCRSSAAARAPIGSCRRGPASSPPAQVPHRSTATCRSCDHWTIKSCSNRSCKKRSEMSVKGYHQNEREKCMSGVGKELYMPCESSGCADGKTFFLVSAVCTPPCENGGQCVEDGVCACPSGFHGDTCESGEHNCSTFNRCSLQLVSPI